MHHLPPIHEAAFRGNLEEVLRLIQQDPQLVNSTDEGDDSTPLIYACGRGHFPVVAALVDHGAHLDYQNTKRETALFMACSRDYAPMVEFLMQKGANPTLPQFLGWTPLMTASTFGYVGVVRCLLHYPSVLPTTDHGDNNGLTALHYACVDGSREIVKMLLEAGADPTIRSNDGNTGMGMAAERGRQGCVILLEEWDRSYTITKARLLHDANYRYQQQGGGASSSSGGGGQASDKRSRVEAAIPTYLKGRVEGGQPLPKVEMVDYEEGSLVESVLEYVICGGLKGELFVGFMEMMGKTGVREG